MNAVQPEVIVSNPKIAETRAKIARFGAMLYQRHLTDAAGGNLSARVDDLVCLSPRYAGSKKQWNLTPDDVLVVDLDGNVLVGDGEISRESKVHLRLHKEFGDYGTGVIHAHARNVLVFAALARSMPPVLEAMRKFGTVPCIDFAPSHSEKLAENVADAIRPQVERIRKQAAGVIAPWHGVFCIGKDIDAAYDAVERFDTNAYIIMMGQLLGQSDLLAGQREAMENACANFTE